MTLFVAFFFWVGLISCVTTGVLLLVAAISHWQQRAEVDRDSWYIQPPPARENWGWPR